MKIGDRLVSLNNESERDKIKEILKTPEYPKEFVFKAYHCEPDRERTDEMDRSSKGVDTESSILSIDDDKEGDRIEIMDGPRTISKYNAFPLLNQNQTKCRSMELVLADPLHACQHLTKGDKEAYVDKYVISLRGKCSFLDKAYIVQSSGG